MREGDDAWAWAKMNLIEAEVEMSRYDPMKQREDRRTEARSAAGRSSPERTAELRATFQLEDKVVRRRTRRAEWTGTMDAVSLPIYAEHGPRPFMHGDNNSWLFPVGAGQNRNGSAGSLPRKLSSGGSIFLRSGGRLVAKVVFCGVEYREERIEHIPSPHGFVDAGPGNVLLVDPNTWELIDIDLVDPAEQGMGYRYYQFVDGVPQWVRSSS